MPRLALPTDAELSEATRAVLGQRPAVAVYRAAAYAPSLITPFMQMASACFEELSFGDRLREMLILRVAMQHDSAYEVHHHRGLALRAGVSDDQIVALLSPVPFMSDDALETAAVRIVDEVIEHGDVDAATFEQVANVLGPQGTTELALLVGFYRMVATFIAVIGLKPDTMTAVQLRDALQFGIDKVA